MQELRIVRARAEKPISITGVVPFTKPQWGWNTSEWAIAEPDLPLERTLSWDNLAQKADQLGNAALDRFQPLDDGDF